MLAAPLILPRCEDVADHVSEFLDGELDERARARVRIHLAVCGGCARLADDLGAIVSALHRLATRRSLLGVERPMAGASSSPIS